MLISFPSLAHNERKTSREITLIGARLGQGGVEKIAIPCWDVGMLGCNLS